MTDRSVNDEDGIGWTESVSVQTWHWFSLDQAMAATWFARRAREIESANTDDAALVREHRSVVIAAIVASVGFLEATVNELTASSAHPNLGISGALSEPRRTALARAHDSLDRVGLLDTFQLVLGLCGSEPFDRGALLFQDADLLIGLRNGLIHYRPVWRGAAAENAPTAKRERALQAKRFSTNPFTGEENPFFPDKCLGFGCCEWAWNASLRFVDEFFSRVGVPPIHQHIRGDLSI